MDEFSITELAVEFAKLKEQKRGFEKQVTDAQAKIETLKTVLSDKLMEEGIQSVKISDIGTIYMEVAQYPKIEDKEKFFSYLEKTEQEDMIKVTVDTNTLKGWWKRQLVEFNPEEVGLSIFKKTDVKIRKG